jgi:circadian clock protein KaiC
MIDRRPPHLSPTGIEGLDAILRGGLPSGNIYLVHGMPGTGKTTLALQFLRTGIAAGERVLYVAFGETQSELEAVARSHGWTLEGIDVCDLHGPEQLGPDAQYTFFHPSEIELGETTKAIMRAIDRVRPRRVVVDSLSEMRLLARDSLRYRRQILGLKHHLCSIGATVVMLDTTSHPGPEFQLETVAHGVIALEQRDPAYGGKRRRLTVEKLRSVAFRDGWHDYVIATGGLRVFPRLVCEGDAKLSGDLASSGDRQLDALLGGGVERGSSTLLVGPSGVGKSTLAMQFVRAAIARGERAAVYLFDESRAAWSRRSEALGLGLHDEGSERLGVQSVNPSELSPGEFADHVRRRVVEDGVRAVVIDSINGYNEAMLEERFLSLHMHELLSFLAAQRVTTILVLATAGGGSNGPAHAPLDLSYISDTIIALRYFEAFGEVRKAISVLKKRTGAHEPTIRELEIGAGSGIRIGERIREFRGVLTGAPEYTGDRERLLGIDVERPS